MITTEAAVGITVIATLVSTIAAVLIADLRDRSRRSRALTQRIPTPRPRGRTEPPTLREPRPVVVQEVRVNAFGELETFAWTRGADTRGGPQVNDFGELS